MKRVLIVDDDDDIVVMLSHLLSDEGYAVHTAPAAAAVDVALTERPDVIVLDIMMPGMDGVEVGRRLRGHQATRTIPIIAMSASHRIVERAEAMQANRLLAKPFDLDDLLTELAHLTTAPDASAAPTL